MRWRAACIALLLHAALGAAEPVEVNGASRAQLEALSGIGTALAARIIEERGRQPFADWADVRRRLKGFGPKVAVRLSDQGLTVNGAPYAAPAPVDGATR